jgi:hypothetical protein
MPHPNGQFDIMYYDAAGNAVGTPFLINTSGYVDIQWGWQINGNIANRLFSDGNMSITQQGYKPGGGSWADSSDARIKTITGAYTQGLDAIKRLDPVRYVFKGNDAVQWTLPDGKKTDRPSTSPHADVLGREFIGLIAQAVEMPMPEMVTKADGWIDGVPVTDLRMLDPNALTYALINAVKELAAKVTALEARVPQPR